jgi:hypothetical protein
MNVNGDSVDMVDQQFTGSDENFTLRIKIFHNRKSNANSFL